MLFFKLYFQRWQLKIMHYEFPSCGECEGVVGFGALGFGAAVFDFEPALRAYGHEHFIKVSL